MSKPVVFMFSGQGSQYYHMGRELYEHSHAFREWMLRLDEMVRSFTGESVLEAIYDKSKDRTAPFCRTVTAGAGIFMVEYSLTRVLMEHGVEPDLLLGASLGEIVSCAVAGVMGFEKLLAGFIQQLEIAEDRCPRGHMTAILSNSDLFHEASCLHENAEIAARNFATHFVVSGPYDRLETIQSFLRENAIPYQTLPVTLPFHSSLIDPIASSYKTCFMQASYGLPQIPIVSCVTGRAVDTVDADHLWDVVRKPIEFQKAILTLEEERPHCYIDVGPSGTLATFVKYNLPAGSQSEALPILAPMEDGVGNFEKVKLRFRGRKRKRRATTSQTHSRLSKKDGKMTTWVFPGQGSQAKGMGAGLFDRYARLTEKADGILGYSIRELCLEDPHRRLAQTLYTQPALYVVNALSYLAELEETGRKPDFAAGHSLGEYSALFAAEVFDFETGLELVKKRAELMAEASGGAMASVCNCSTERVVQFVEENGLAELDIANLNTPTQVVVSGPVEGIREAVRVFDGAGVLCVPLNVSGAFHSRHMRPAMEAFERFIAGFAFSPPTLPVISNVHARPYRHGEIGATLAHQISHPVRWTESIQYLMSRGEMEFKEIGPGKVLTKLIADIRKTVPPSPATRGNGGGSGSEFTGHALGSHAFKKEYNLDYAYVMGGMTKGIASVQLVVQAGRAGMMGFFGTGGMDCARVEEAILAIQNGLKEGGAYGMNLVASLGYPQMDERAVDLFLKHGVRNLEAAAFMEVTPALVRFRLKGLEADGDGGVTVQNRIMAKVSRPEVAEAFLSPAPEAIVTKLLAEHKITRTQAELCRKVAMADDVCVESDSGGHTDQGIMTVLLPTMIRLRDAMHRRFEYRKKVRIGAAGGIGDPEAAAAAFLMGAEFILTGSINQCTVEAGTSDAAKDILQSINVQDTAYAPAGDMFEMGSRVQVVRKGLFFPARANKLHELYRQYNSLDEIDEKTRAQLQQRYFKRSFDQIYAETKQYYMQHSPEEIHRAERNPKQKMALIFRWYFIHAMRLALEGDTENKVDFQIHCGPALGAFNQWVKGTELEPWKNRHAARIGKKLMDDTAALLGQRLKEILPGSRTL